MQSKDWALILGGILAICLGLSIPLFLPQEATYAEIWSEGKKIETLSLSVDRVLIVESRYGTNVITVQDGKIAVTEADCPDGHCQSRGYTTGGSQIVCLPNRLVIRFPHGQTLDGVVG